METAPEQLTANEAETPAPTVEINQAPVELELKTTESTGLKEKATKESIEASIKEKLSRKTDNPEPDPFVPSTQLANEVKDVANKQGFALSRGTEIGARLMARARRVDK
jgi:hypothetical protein